MFGTISVTVYCY